MKKILTVMVLIVDVAFGANAANEIVDGVTWYYETFSDGGVTCARIISGQVEYVGDLKIPSALGGSPVTEIQGGAFYLCTGVTSVVIPEGVRVIGNGAFYKCTGLRSVSIPESVVGIGGSAFCGCGVLEAVEIPSRVTYIGEAAFSGCVGLTAAVIPSNVTRIENWTFEDCRGLKSVTISEGVTSIGQSAFLECSGLTQVLIPSSVTSIGCWAFSRCDGLCEIMVAEGNLSYKVENNCLVSIDDMSLVAVPYGCREVNIPRGVLELSDYVFKSDVNLRAVTIPSGVRRISDAAFKDCTGLTSIAIPEGVRIVGNYAFEGCSGLESVAIPSSVIGIYYRAFAGCSSLKTVYVGRDCDVDALKKMLQESGVDVNRVTFDYAGEPERVDCKVVFNAQGGTAAWTEVTVPNGEVVGELPTATWEGYEFLGWFTAAVGGAKVTATTVVTEDVTFYAYWKRIGSTADEEVIAGDKVTIETGLVGYKASGLPKGLSYNAKTGKITGTTKSVTAGAVEVVFTKAGEEEVRMTFEVRAEDVSVGCEALATGSFQSGVMGAAGGMPIETFCETGVKSVSVTKLPSGMKYDSKNRLITGAPNKAGVYEVVLTVTTTSGAKDTVKIPVSVAAMPMMAVGTFNGFVSVGEDNLGTFTLTTTDAGKLTAKVITAAGTVSFSGTCWDSVEDGVYRATLTTKKGEKLTLMLDSTAAWDADQLSGEFTTAAIAETKKAAVVPSRTYSVTAQRNAFGKTWYFAATGDETTGWKLAYTEDTKGAALTVTLKADGSISIAGKLPNGTDAKGKAVTIKVSASGYANVGGLKDGAILADFAPVLAVNKAKTVLAIKTNLWFDRLNNHASGVGEARFVK